MPNKIDVPDAADRLDLLHEFCPLDFPEFVISAQHGTGLEDLRNAIYAALDVVRVYTKLPTHKEPDYERPFTVRRGGTLLDVAELVHKDFAQSLKYARVWGSQSTTAPRSKGDYVLHDKDVVELHVGVTMTNAEIAAVFEQVADLLEFKDDNPFRVRAYRNAARTIRDLPESVAAIVADNRERLLEIDGIGKAVAEKATTLVRTGQLPLLDELLAEIPESVLAILRIPGLGPKKAAAVFHELGIKTLDDLQTACEAGRVRELKGFGAKTEKAILDGIAIAASAGQRMYWAEADQIAQELREHLRSCAEIEQLELAGSYRRGSDTVGDLDFLVVAGDVGGSDGPLRQLSRRGGCAGPRRHQDVGPAEQRLAGRSADRAAPSRSERRCSTSPARRTTTSSSAAWPSSAG